MYCKVSAGFTLLLTSCTLLLSLYSYNVQQDSTGFVNILPGLAVVWWQALVLSAAGIALGVLLICFYSGAQPAQGEEPLEAVGPVQHQLLEHGADQLHVQEGGAVANGLQVLVKLPISTACTSTVVHSTSV
jgi:hypothetical protein